jgi:hypothetical protein
MIMDRHDDMGSGEVGPEISEAGGGEMPPEVTSQPAAPRVERKRRKVSLIAAIVVNVITIITVAIVMLAILLPGYRKSFTMAKAVKGADDVWIVVRTSETNMREQSTDFIHAQDGLKNALQELVGGGSTVHAYVRDNYPDQEWVEENLPDAMKEWLRELYPKASPQTQENNIPET